MKYLQKLVGLLIGLLGLFLIVQPAHGQITPESIYKNPDDHALNLEYAKQQILKGELLDAASALERMLFSNPSWHSARLLYSAVLYRLDDQQAALRELSLLENKTLNDEQLAKLETYKIAFLKPPVHIEAGLVSYKNLGFDQRSSFRSNDRLQGQVALQLRADDNAGNALTDVSFGFNNQGDISTVLKGGVRAFIPKSDNWTIRGAVAAQARRHDTFSDVDYDVIDGSIGATFAKDKSIIAVDLDTRKININGETYLKQIGPRLTFSRNLNGKTYANVSFSVYNQDYSNLENTFREEERDGRRLSIQAGILHRINARNQIRIATAIEEKEANIAEFSYTGPSLAVAYDHKINEQVYVKVHGKIRYLDYDRNLDDGFEQKETRITGRLAIGKKIDLGAASLKSAALEFGSSITRRGSNLTVNDFENFGLDAGLTVGF